MWPPIKVILHVRMDSFSVSLSMLSISVFYDFGFQGQVQQVETVDDIRCSIGYDSNVVPVDLGGIAEATCANTQMHDDTKCKHEFFDVVNWYNRVRRML